MSCGWCCLIFSPDEEYWPDTGFEGNLDSMEIIPHHTNHVGPIESTDLKVSFNALPPQAQRTYAFRFAPVLMINQTSTSSMD